MFTDLINAYNALPPLARYGVIALGVLFVISLIKRLVKLAILVAILFVLIFAILILVGSAPSTY
jgi:hypothetical protein